MLCDEVIILAAIGIRSTAGMEAYFPRKAAGGLFAPGGVACSIKSS